MTLLQVPDRDIPIDTFAQPIAYLSFNAAAQSVPAWLGIELGWHSPVRLNPTQPSLVGAMSGRGSNRFWFLEQLTTTRYNSLSPRNCSGIRCASALRRNLGSRRGRITAVQSSRLAVRRAWLFEIIGVGAEGRI